MAGHGQSRVNSAWFVYAYFSGRRHCPLTVANAAAAAAAASSAAAPVVVAIVADAQTALRALICSALMTVQRAAAAPSPFDLMPHF